MWQCATYDVRAPSLDREMIEAAQAGGNCRDDPVARFWTVARSMQWTAMGDCNTTVHVTLHTGILGRRVRRMTFGNGGDTWTAQVLCSTDSQISVSVASVDRIR